MRLRVLCTSVLLALGSLASFAQAPTITKQPIGATVLAGSSPTLKVSASSATPLQYQWQFNNNPIPGATDNQLTLANVQLGQAGPYRVEVANAAGRVLSDVATVAVFERATIVVQPQDLDVALGHGAILSVQAKGIPAPSYQWKFNGQAIPGATHTQWVIPTAGPTDEGKYRVRVTNPYAGMDSDEVTLSVLREVNLTEQPADARAIVLSPTYQHGAAKVPNPQFTVVAEGDDLQYQWYHNGTAIPSASNRSATTSTLELGEVQSAADGGQYVVEVWNNVGRVTSRAAQLDVLGISVQPQDQIVPVAPGTTGATVGMQVAGFGNNLRYLWRRNGQPIPGATDAVLVKNAAPADGGQLDVVVLNDWGMVVSDPAVVSVCAQVLPFEDDFARRGVIATLSGSGCGDNTRASRENGEPYHAQGKGRRSVWLTWVAPETGIATFDTSGSAFDSVLAVYSGTTLGSLLSGWSVSDNESGGFRASRVSFNAIAGRSYQIAVDGYGRRDSGNIVLTWDTIVTPCLMPENIQVTSDLTLSLGGSVDLYGIFDVLQTPCPLTVQWYQNDLPITSTAMGVALRQVDVRNVGNYRLLIRSDDWDYWSKPIELEINTEGASSAARKRLDDARSSPLIGVLNGGTFSGRLGKSLRRPKDGGGMPEVRGYSGSQLFYTYPGKDPTEPNACGVVGGGSYWFSYAPPETGSVLLNTDGSSFDTILGVYRDDGRDLGYASLIPVACDNDSGTNHLTSSLRYQGSPGVTNYIMVDGVTNACGVAYLNYRMDSLPAVSAIPNLSLNEDQEGPNIPFTIGDRETAATNLTLSGVCGNTNLIPKERITFAGSGTDRTVKVRPNLYKYGTNTVTVSVTDAAGGVRSTNFIVWVKHVNHPPAANTASMNASSMGPTSIPISTLLAKAADVDGDYLTVTAVSSTSQNSGTVYKSSSVVTYTPPATFYPTDRFTYTLTDNKGGTVTGTVYVSVLMAD